MTTYPLIVLRGDRHIVRVGEATVAQDGSIVATLSDEFFLDDNGNHILVEAAPLSLTRKE